MVWCVKVSGTVLNNNKSKINSKKLIDLISGFHTTLTIFLYEMKGNYDWKTKPKLNY